MTLFLILILIAVCVILFKSYRIVYDTIIAYTGGLGSGKSFLSVKMSIRLLHKNRRKVRLHNFFERLKTSIKKSYTPNEWEEPQLYASIPVRINRNEWAIRLKPEHLLLTKRIIPRSVVFIDEVGSWASQFDFSNPNIADNFDECVRFFRHYTLGGYLVVNDQCSENIVLQIRRRINTVFNLMHFKKWFKIVYTVRVRNISISEEIKTIEQEDTEDNMTILWGFMPLFFKHYDTYCYSNRYKTVPAWKERLYTRYKKNELLRMPTKRVQKKTTDEEDPETVGEMLSIRRSKTNEKKSRCAERR